MPTVSVNGIRLRYRDEGDGPPVVLVAGAGGGADTWSLYQVPALLDAGHRVVTYDSRGIPPTDECPDGFGVEDLVDDLAALSEALELGPARYVGSSMGSYVVAELALARPDLVRSAVLMSSLARCDALRTALAYARCDAVEPGVELPEGYAAVVAAMQMLSPSTLDDEEAVLDWLALFEAAPDGGDGFAAQLALQPMPDRRDAYAGITVPCHVLSFADDLITPPKAGRELAGVIPGATFEVVAEAGHLGFLERPEAVLASILAFFGRDEPARAERTAS